MSKEAKIGLLMGLVFIVGIGLLLRGVQQNSNQMLDEELAINSDVVAGSSAAVPESVNLPEAVRQLDEPTVSAAGRGIQSRDNPSGPVEQPWIRYPDLAAVHTGPPEMLVPLSEPATYTSQGVRWEQELPRPMQSPVVVAPRGDLTRALNSLTEPVVGVDPLINAAANRMKTYVVQRGDNLSSIAKKCYGAVEGNRRKNIKLIYEANCDKLPSMDEVFEGQTLKIPALAGQSSRAVRANSSRAVNNSSSTSQRNVTRVYVVCEYDSLWGIAAEKLGSSVRYKEIAQLNNMKDEDRLLVGDKLKLPAK